MNDLFKIIPANFFSILSSPNRHIYLDCIFIIYESIDTIEDAFTGEREYVVNKLIDYFEDHAATLHEHEATTARQKSVAVINALKAHGWLGEEELGDYKVSLNLFDYSIRIIEILKQIKNNESTQYTGEIFAVYSLLSSFSVTEGLGIIEQAAAKTKEILLKLKSLKANIYRFYYSITQNHKKEDLQNLLELLLVDYKQNFFDSAYYNLKTADALPRYKKAILQSLANILNDNETLEAFVTEIMLTKKIDYMDAFSYVEDSVRFMQEAFEGLELLITAIDRKNEQYIHAVTAKIMFLASSSDSIEGLINQLFKLMAKDTTIDIATIFNLTRVRNLDTNSLFSPRRYREDPIIQELFDPEDIDPDLYEQMLQRVITPTTFTKANINEYVMGLLKKTDVINADQLRLLNDEDYIRLLLIFIYSKSVDIDYDIKMLDQVVSVDGIRFKNFMIFRKGI